MICLTIRVVGFRFNAFCQAKRSQRKQESTGATPQALQRIQKKVISVWGFSVAALRMQLTPSIRYRSIASPLWILPLKKTPKSCARQESAKSDAGRGAASFNRAEWLRCVRSAICVPLLGLAHRCCYSFRPRVSEGELAFVLGKYAIRSTCDIICGSI